MASSNISDVIATEREALRETGGITDGSIATNVKPSTPRAPADVRPERMTSRDPDAFPVITGREEEWRFTPARPRPRAARRQCRRPTRVGRPRVPEA